MINLLLAFITGLTTGGLSCLAVQGGLLASSLANQIENDFQPQALKTRQVKSSGVQRRPEFGLPILVFLVAKLIAYSLLGLLLGWAGQVFQLSPYARAALQIGIGVFMLGTALRMLNAHSIFRVFAFEPPAFLRRWLRKTAKGAEKDSLIAPAFLGFITVLIPCGVTQAMMAAALGTGDPLQAAALMFAFTLGTSPVFFVVAYSTTRMGARLEKNFKRFVAVIVLGLALVTIDGGVVLAGSPVSASRFLRSVFSAPTQAARLSQESAPQETSFPGVNIAADPYALPGMPSDAEAGEITIQVINSGYSPQVIHARAGMPIRLKLVSENVQSCSRAFVISSLGVQVVLKATDEAIVEIPAQESGAEITFSCSMGMYGGTILFDL